MFWKKPAVPGQAKTNVRIATKEAVELERRSDGFNIRVAIAFSGASEAEPLASGLKLVDAVLGSLSGFGIKIAVEERGAGAEKAEMVKNAGFAFGEGLRKLIEKRKAKDSGSSIHSDGNSMAMFAISAKRQPGEANLQIIGKPERGFDPEHFFSFFDGLAQGMEAEVNAVVNFGKTGEIAKKNQMEFVSKTFASTLRQIFI